MSKESDEREFLHDIASPIGAALFSIGSVLESLQTLASSNPDELEQLQITKSALESVRDMLEKRREILIQRGVPSGRS